MGNSVADLNRECLDVVASIEVWLRESLQGQIPADVRERISVVDAGLRREPNRAEALHLLSSLFECASPLLNNGAKLSDEATERLDVREEVGLGRPDHDEARTLDGDERGPSPSRGDSRTVLVTIEHLGRAKPFVPAGGDQEDWDVEDWDIKTEVRPRPCRTILAVVEHQGRAKPFPATDDDMED